MDDDGGRVGDLDGALEVWGLKRRHGSYIGVQVVERGSARCACVCA